jgi:RimJ/RimL family protein N-acetyltransferase
VGEGGDASHRVSLRVVEDSDLDVLFEQQADPEAAAMAAFPTRDRERFDAHWARIRLDDTVVLRTILTDGLVVGNIGSWQDDGKWLIGYWIGREYWGRGVATQALALLVGEVSTRPLYAHVATHNVGSIRVLQKCGFERNRVQEAQAPQPEDGIEEFIFMLAG